MTTAHLDQFDERLAREDRRSTDKQRIAELLVALKNLADEFEEFMSEHGQLDNKPLHAARAAIAKAEGQS